MLAIELWQRFDQQLLNSSVELCKSLVHAFSSSPFLLEYKLYFLEKAYTKMNFKQMDQIITQLERHIFPHGSDHTSLLVFQVNPLKAAMQLQDVLTNITEKYPVFDLRLKLLNEEVLA